MKTIFLRRSVAVIFAATALMISVVGCSDSAMTPSDSYVEAPNMLYRSLAKVSTDSTGDVEEEIADSTALENNTGGVVSVGDDEIGNSSLEVPGDALEPEFEGTQVSMFKMRVTRFGQVTARLGPHGYRFRRPVWFTLSYRNADLNGVDENSLKMMYLNEDVEPPVWEIVEGSVVNTYWKTVSAPLQHFSRYGIGSDE